MTTTWNMLGHMDLWHSNAIAQSCSLTASVSVLTPCATNPHQSTRCHHQLNRLVAWVSRSPLHSQTNRRNYIITLFNPMHFWKMRHGDFFLSFLQLRYEIRPQVTIIAPVIIKLVCLCSRWPDCRSQASAGCLLQPSLCRVSYSLVKTEVKAPRAHPSNSCWLSFSEKKSLPSSVSVPLPDLLGQLVTLTEW